MGVGPLAVGTVLLGAWWLLSGGDGQESVALSLSNDVPGGGYRRLALPDPVEARLPDGLGRQPMELLAPTVVPPVAEQGAPVPLEQLHAWIEDLRDDDIPRNAREAADALRPLLRADETDGPVMQALEAALRSDDGQQRFLAAMFLQADGRAAPSGPLLHLSLDMLCAGRLDGDEMTLDAASSARGQGDGPQNTSLHYLVRHGDACAPQLVALLDRPYDEEAQFLAAYVLAMNGRTDLVDRLAPRLIGRLADNMVGADAEMATGALSRLGDRAQWWLRASPSRDRQHEYKRRKLIEYLSMNAEERIELHGGRKVNSRLWIRGRYEAHSFRYYGSRSR